VFDAVLATQAGEGNADAFDDLGEQWRFDSVSHKYHACCHGTHAMIECLNALNIPRKADVSAITVRTNPRWMTVCNKTNPTSWLEGKFSYRFLAAMTVDRQDTFDRGPELYFPITDKTRQMMSAVTVIADAAIAETASHVTVQYSSGETCTATHDLAKPEPLEQRARNLRAKADRLIRPVHAQAVWDAVEAQDLASFTAAIRHT